MQVNLHGSTAPQSTTNFTTEARHFSSANSASTIMSQAERPKEKSFLTTVVDFVTSIPGKIWGFVQWLFCCNTVTVSLTAKGLLDDPQGVMNELEKHPEKTQEFMTNLGSDPMTLLELVLIFTDPAKLNAWMGKISDPDIKAGLQQMVAGILKTARP